jgi:S-DNA-T family DNA segregation ATPase FtsK/SpoIIIE
LGRSASPPQDFVPDELRKTASAWPHGPRFVLTGKASARRPKLLLDPPPPAGVCDGIFARVGAGSKDSNRVEVPFASRSPAGGYLEEETTNLLRVPIGRTGATKLQYLAIGKGTRQHALFAGKTGSGKSTLFHVIITNLALRCSPEQVEFYLIDFKKGVEFKCYAKSICRTRGGGHRERPRIRPERAPARGRGIARRGDLFRKLGVQDVAGYKRAAARSRCRARC